MSQSDSWEELIATFNWDGVQFVQCGPSEVGTVAHAIPDLSPPKCDCGAEKCKTSHSGWCSTQQKAKP